MSVIQRLVKLRNKGFDFDKDLHWAFIYKAILANITYGYGPNRVLLWFKGKAFAIIKISYIP
ncbi:hypothetical protein DLE54_00340 [Psychrobacter sp. YP14]|jgi:hypothetical protein|nr:hypothetical protein DLE54_00340 [Psychrobacter sp. YP14]